MKDIKIDEVLRCGIYLADDNLYCKLDNLNNKDINYNWVRIRIILYNKKLYYHKMIDGNVAEFKELIA